MKKPLIIWHEHCMDGFTAAWAMWKKFGDSAEYSAQGYQKPPPEGYEGRDVYIVDFSYPRDVLTEMSKKVTGLFVYDHHKTAAKDLDGLEFPDLPSKIFFDQNRSGAGLAWDLTHETPRPRLVNYIEDADLWKWTQPNATEIRMTTETITFDFKLWDEYAARLDSEEGFKTTVENGRVILHYRDCLVARLVEEAGVCNLAGHLVPCINSKVWQSELGNVLARGDPKFSVVWSAGKNGATNYSLRSDKNCGMDVSEIARQFGGGGHKNAAGFRSNAPPMMIQQED